MRRPWIGALLVLAALAALALQTSIVVRTGFTMGDFRAFYCAARVASHGADPYRTEPLRSCETGIGTTMFFEKNPGVTIPAPLPGYAIAALVPLSVLPFAAAATIWSLLLLAAWLACILALSRFAQIQWESALAVFALSLGVVSLPLGEVVPVALACICLAAYFAWRGRAAAAAFAGAGAMIEPHLGLPVCIALAVWMPGTRVALAVTLGALAALSLAVVGVGTNVEYFTSVLPAHALSELGRDTQFSLTAVLAGAGLAPAAAVRAGSLWYVAMIVAGTVLAGAFARRTRNDAFIVCIPPAFAVFGGTFIHITQIAAALPAAALLAGSCTPKHRSLAVTALLLLAIPWVWAVSPALVIAPLVPAAYLAWRYWSPNVPAILLTGIVAAGVIFGLSSLAAAAPHAAHAAAPAIDPRLAEASWSAFTQKSSTNAFATWMLRLPTWLGLGLLLVLLAREGGWLRMRAPAAALAFVAAACTVLPIGAQLYGDAAARNVGVDFRAYYCAALAQREGANPYYVQPLHDCERNAAAPYYRPPANVTVPVPYPPYVLALLAPLTFLSFADAMFAWWSVVAIAMLAAAYALARAVRQPFVVGWAALGLALGLTSFSAGNMAPIGIAAIVVAGLCAARNRPVLAAVAMALAMVEPQVALPAAVALFAAFPAARLPLAAAAAALAGLSLLGGGVAHNVAYVTSVIPAHALSEISRDNQYSLSSVIAAFGVPDASAAFVGSVSYVVMAALGIVVGLRLARHFGDPALAIFVPPAFALLGGTFVHTAEIAAAVPACVALCTRAPVYRGWIVAALVLLAVPWMMATSAALFLAPIFPAAYLTYAFWHRDRKLALAVAVAAYAAIFGLFVLASATPPHPSGIARALTTIDPRLAEASWQQFVLGNSTNRLVMWLLRLPTWIGLIALAASAVALMRSATGTQVGAEYRLTESRA